MIETVQQILQKYTKKLTKCAKGGQIREKQIKEHKQFIKHTLFDRCLQKG